MGFLGCYRELRPDPGGDRANVLFFQWVRNGTIVFITCIFYFHRGSIMSPLGSFGFFLEPNLFFRRSRIVQTGPVGAVGSRVRPEGRHSLV
jgi:hypothetical protein